MDELSLKWGKKHKEYKYPILVGWTIYKIQKMGTKIQPEIGFCPNLLDSSTKEIFVTNIKKFSDAKNRIASKTRISQIIFYNFFDFRKTKQYFAKYFGDKKPKIGKKTACELALRELKKEYNNEKTLLEKQNQKDKKLTQNEINEVTQFFKELVEKENELLKEEKENELLKEEKEIEIIKKENEKLNKTITVLKQTIRTAIKENAKLKIEIKKLKSLVNNK